jgi:hypothetical protein
MTDKEDGERKILYRAVVTFSMNPIESESLADLLKIIEEDRQDGIVKIMISEREVGSLRIENKKIFILELVDETPQEVDVVKKYPVYDRISMKALLDKYLDSIAGDMIEDNGFIENVRSLGNKRNPDNQQFILLLWNRYWNVLSRFRGDSKDGIYLIGERDIYREGDRNTFLSV